MNPSTPPTPIDLLLRRAFSLHTQGRVLPALEVLQQVISREPGNFQALHGAGILCAQMGRQDKALAYLSAAVRVRPGDCAAMNNLGNALHVLNRLEEALEAFDKALLLEPDSAALHHNRGNTLRRMNRPDKALAGYERAIALKPDYAEAFNNRGLVLAALGRHEDALTSLDRAIALTPDYAAAYNNRGLVLAALDRHEDALTSLDRATILKPNYAGAYNNRGNILTALNRAGEALASFDRAICLKPNHAAAHNNRGHTLTVLGRLEEALASFDRAISLKPDYAEAHNNRGAALQGIRLHDEALAGYDRALAVKPDYADARYNKALLLLLLGNYEDGWPLHEWRWKTPQLKTAVREFAAPLWRGDRTPAGKTILLHGEQGLGDVIQFARYAPLVAALGARVILEAQLALVPLLESLPGRIALIGRGDPLPPFDLHCPLMSLPLAFGTTVATVPASVPYLSAAAGKRRLWGERLGTRVRPRVGLAWSGQPDHKNDLNRSIGLRPLEPLLGLDIAYHALHKEIRAQDQAVLEHVSGLRTHEAELHDFSDTAALIGELDLVITVDTSVAHLAGALGREVWILLPYAPDHRWLTDRADSPWYPTARLFRQRRRGDWEGVVEEVHQRLQDRFGADGHGR